MSDTAARRTAPSPSPSLVAFALACDAALILLFAGLGRRSHDEAGGFSGILQTAWPFLAGAAIVWGVALVWRRPLSVLNAGVPVWFGAVGIGMVLRWATVGMPALPFVIVATVTLGVFLLGWRGIALLVRRLRRRS